MNGTTEDLPQDRMERRAEKLTVENDRLRNALEALDRDSLPRLSERPSVKKKPQAPLFYAEVDSELGGDVEDKLAAAFIEADDWVGDQLAEFRELVER